MRHCFVKSSSGYWLPNNERFMPPTKKCSNVLGYWRYVAAKSRCRWLGQENLATLVRGLEERLFRNKGFSVRNMQCMIQFFNEYNQELTMVKGADSSMEVCHNARCTSFLFITIQICSLSLSCDLLKISLIYVFPASKNSSCKLIKQSNQPVHTLFCQFCTHLFYIEGNG